MVIRKRVRRKESLDYTIFRVMYHERSSPTMVIIQQSLNIDYIQVVANIIDLNLRTTGE